MIAEKWILYYFPLLKEERRILQISKKSLAFEASFRPVIEYYKDAGDLSLLHMHLHDGNIPADVMASMDTLFRQVAKTVESMPMRYIGSSIYNRPYGLFHYHKPSLGVRFSLTNPFERIYGLGMVSIPRDYYEVFNLFGSYIMGDGGLLSHWADFCVRSSPDGISQKHRILNILTKSPVLERDMKTARETYTRLIEQKGSLHCVWTQTSLGKYDIDHVIPFSAHYNNDLWNLLPATPSVNREKSDRIPSMRVLEKRKPDILNYWEELSRLHPGLFFHQLQNSLTGFQDGGEWKELAFVRLRESCNRLIHERGYNTWEPK